MGFIDGWRLLRYDRHDSAPGLGAQGLSTFVRSELQWTFASTKDLNPQALKNITEII